MEYTQPTEQLKDFKKIIVSNNVIGEKIPDYGAFAFYHDDSASDGLFFWDGDPKDAKAVYSHIRKSLQSNLLNFSLQEMWFCDIKEVFRADVEWKTAPTLQQKYGLLEELKKICDGYNVDIND